ncbi:glycosyltransferase family 4 protein [Ornithinimicrobium cavernae]|uniref:glycosyltransferase family 4 protein n=1 Tax=Ornithinimicrobium cavernae TaxID=2666047 RepID=UPI001379EE4C|nr:glycosyltransferase family 1 protein [Ornithinimicrobium cavernae]
MGTSPAQWNVPRAREINVAGGALGRRLAGRYALQKALDKDPVDVLINMGNEVTSVPDVPSIMWPMTVAPLEEAAMRRLGPTLPAKLRWRTLRESIGQSVRRADSFIFNSHYTRAIYAETFQSVTHKPSTVIWPATSIPPEDTGVNPASARSRPYILAVSHLYPYKMVLELIRGYALVVQGGVPHDLVIAGSPADPDYYTQLQQEVANNGLDERVIFLGNVERRSLGRLYKEATLFVSPSISENAASFTLLDAFGHGLPVLASSTSSMPEMCQDAVRYFDPRSPHQMGEAMLEVLNDDTTLAELARRGQVRFNKLPTWETVAEDVAHFAATMTGQK